MENLKNIQIQRVTITRNDNVLKAFKNAINNNVDISELITISSITKTEKMGKIDNTKTYTIQFSKCNVYDYLHLMRRIIKTSQSELLNKTPTKQGFKKKPLLNPSVQLKLIRVGIEELDKVIINNHLKYSEVKEIRDVLRFSLEVYNNIIIKYI